MATRSLHTGRNTPFSTRSPPRYEFKESAGLPLVFRSKRYPSASEALSAYISDFEGRERRHNGAKYDEELMSLFCPQYQPVARAGKPSHGVVRHGKSRREEELEKLVQQAYDQLKRLKENKKVEESLNASTKLIERLDRDRLPSPTRSAILAPSGRPSTESVATDVLLAAKPLDFTAPYSLPTQSHANSSLLESLDLKSGTVGDSFSTLKGPYQLKGMNELMNNIQRDSVIKPTSRSYSTDSLTVDDLLTSQKTSPLDLNQRSFVGDTFPHDGGLLSASQLGNIRQRLSNDYPHTAAADSSLHNTSDNIRISGLVSDYRGLNSGHMSKSNGAVPNGLPPKDMKELDLVLDNSWSRSSHSYKTTQEIGQASSLRQGQNSSSGGTKHRTARPDSKFPNSRHKFNGVSSLPAYLSTGHGMNRSYADKSAASSRTDQSSSIISGHMLKGKQKRGISKVVSTPKRADQSTKRTTHSKQLRFDLDRSRLGHSLDSKDMSAHSKSLDLSNIERVSVEKPDFTYGRKEIVSILKPPSPGKVKRGGSRVSFTTDDLIQADASGLADIEHRPRSRSLPRPQITPENAQYSTESPHRHGSRADPDYDHSEALFGRSRARMQQPEEVTAGVKQGKYKQFLEGLMREIEESSSSIATGGLAQSQADTSHQLAPPSADIEGPGFLARVKELLTSPPSVSRYLADATQDESLSTEAVLDGDRSWERIVAFKAPKAVQANAKTEKTRFEKFMDDCMAEAEGHDKTLTGSAQPGALETLKNMMFKMQSFSSEPQPQEQDDTVEGETNLPLDDSIDKLLSPETRKLLSKSYAQQPGGPCLAKAMEHLSKLKDLVDHRPGVES